jgi:hypothetical protein
MTHTNTPSCEDHDEVCRRRRRERGEEKEKRGEVGWGGGRGGTHTPTHHRVRTMMKSGAEYSEASTLPYKRW